MAFEDMNMGNAFDWDSAIEKDSEFVILPEGIYEFEITGFERAHHPGSAKLPACPKAVLTVKVNGGSLGTTTITHNLFLHSKVEGLLCAFFTCIGMRKHDERIQMQWDKVLGSKGWCKVYVDNFIGKDGQERQSNKIDRFIAPEDAPKPVMPTESVAIPKWQPKR
jgi:hypothetical protein